MVDEVRSEATLLVLVRPKFPESSVSQTGMGLGIDEGVEVGVEDGVEDGGVVNFGSDGGFSPFLWSVSFLCLCNGSSNFLSDQVIFPALLDVSVDIYLIDE